ncbi:hypothetical protein B0O99DRAFT_156998 [Bisporella sp. PMI_857]|nr:hypothetical protein B0O99DRAFT_156998 [Bisporella sp. PMI_857]
MRRISIFTALCASAICLVLFSIRATTKGLRFCPWPNTLNCRARVIYEAPLLNCDVPKEEIVPDSYVVFLHQGYSLDKHKQAVGVNIDSAIQYIVNETAVHGLYYRAGFDNATLAAVRTDIGVDVVECNRKVHPTVSGDGDL